jgi:hypothetical protein
LGNLRPSSASLLFLSTFLASDRALTFLNSDRHFYEHATDQKLAGPLRKNPIYNSIVLNFG